MGVLRNGVPFWKWGCRTKKFEKPWTTLLLFWARGGIKNNLEFCPSYLFVLESLCWITITDSDRILDLNKIGMVKTVIFHIWIRFWNEIVESELDLKKAGFILPSNGKINPAELCHSWQNNHYTTFEKCKSINLDSVKSLIVVNSVTKISWYELIKIFCKSVCCDGEFFMLILPCKLWCHVSDGSCCWLDHYVTSKSAHDSIQIIEILHWFIHSDHRPVAAAIKTTAL